MQAMLFPMELNARMVIIVIVGVFMAAFLDGIAGGGGIISVPTYFLAGLPAHLALGTNKLSSCLGTTVSTARFIRSGFVDWKLGLPSIALALFGSHLGTRLQLALDERWLKWLLLAVLPLVAFVVLRNRTLPEEKGDIAPGKQFAIVMAASFLVGGYDGFYGPGTGTFLILIFTHLAKMDLRTASGNVKLMNGKVFIALGLIGAVSSVLGHYIGSGLAIKDGSKIVRPVILVVLVLLVIKVGSELFV